MIGEQGRWSLRANARARDRGQVIQAGRVTINEAPKRVDDRVPARRRRLKASNLPPRNPDFTGRDGMLDGLRQGLAEGPVAVVAVRGLGGIGKTQVVLEFAHRSRAGGDYDLVWWVRAESTLTLTEDLAGLATELGLGIDADRESAVAALRVELREALDRLKDVLI